MALTVTYRAVSDGGELSEAADAMSSDISASGLRLMTPTKLQSGATLDLEIFLGADDSNVIAATGEVAWQSKVSGTSFETGVVIRYMQESDKKKFMQFVFDQMARAIGLIS